MSSQTVRVKGRQIFVGVDARILCRPNPRGMGRYLRELLLRAPADIALTIYGERECLPDLDPQIATVGGICAFDLRGYRFQLWEQLGLPLHAKRNREDVFFSPATTCPVWQPCPHVVTLHDAYPWSEAGRREGLGPRWLYDHVLPIAYRQAKRVITISDYSRKESLEHFPALADKITVIHHGIDEGFKPDVEWRPDLLGLLGVRKPYLLYVGGDVQKKRPQYALEVFAAAMAGSNDPLMLLMLGMTPGCEDQVALWAGEVGCAGKVVPLPPVTDGAVAMLFSNAEAVLYPTLHEGFGFPVLEAQASGTPILVSNVASIPEIAGRGAYLIDPHDFEAWVGTLRSVLAGDASWEARRTEGLVWASRFSWDACAKKTFELLRAAARSASRVDSKEPGGKV